MTNRNFKQEEFDFVKKIYDKLFTDHPELKHTDATPRCWLDQYAKYPFIEDYDKSISVKFGDKCLIDVQLPYTTIRGFSYDFWCYIDTVIKNYNYQVII